MIKFQTILLLFDEAIRIVIIQTFKLQIIYLMHDEIYTKSHHPL